MQPVANPHKTITWPRQPQPHTNGAPTPPGCRPHNHPQSCINIVLYYSARWNGQSGARGLSRTSSAALSPTALADVRNDANADWPRLSNATTAGARGAAAFFGDATTPAPAPALGAAPAPDGRPTWASIAARRDDRSSNKLDRGARESCPNSRAQQQRHASSTPAFLPPYKVLKW